MSDTAGRAKQCTVLQTLNHKMLLQFFLAFLFISATHSTPDCSSYHYEFEPIAELPCNPYASNETDLVQLECGVRGPLLPNDTSLAVKWVRRLDSEETVESLDSLAETNPEQVGVELRSVVTQTTSGKRNVVRSSLTLHDVISNDAVGSYHCVVVVTVTDLRTANQTVFVSEASSTATIRGADEYTGPACDGSSPYTAEGTACVSFSGGEVPLAIRVPVTTTMGSDDEAPPTTTPPSTTTSRPTTVSATTPTTPPPDTPPSEGLGIIDGTLLSTTMIIILAAIGSSLCIVIHILLALVSCLCAKSRRRKRVREISDSRKISTASLISSVPTSVISLPPNHGLPTPAGALGVNVATTHVIPTSAINVPISTPSGQQYFNALAPPSHPPPVAPSSQLIHPQTHLIHHRSTLPSRLTNQVSDEPEVMVGNGRVMTTEEENYASIVQARHERRAATIAGDMNLYGPPDHVHQAERASLNLEVAEGSYKSLNQYLMDDQQVYEHPSRMLGSIDDDDDDHVVEAYNEEEEVVEAYKEEEEARYQVRNDGGVKFYDDSDDDSIYMQTIVRNTGNVKTNTSDTADTSDTTNTSDTSLAKVSKAKTTTKSTDKGAGLLLRDIPLPPQCPIPIPPNCKLSPPTGSARLPGLHLLPSSRSPSPMPPTVSGLGGGVACGEAPPPPSIHLIPTRSPSPKPPAITTSPPAESASSSSSNSSISSSSSGSSSNEASNPTARVQLLPPQATGPTNPRTGGIEIPPPRLLNPNTYSQLRPKLQSPIAHPLISQKLTSLVPVSRVSMDGEYVVPNEALEQEGDLLSQQDRVRDDDGEEGELPDYIDIS